MCTLTLVKKQTDGFILTFNRDEVVERSNAKLTHNKDTGVIYPVDEKHGGTWLAYNPDNKRFTCLLNGAFNIHERQPPYRLSRGKVVLDTFTFPTIEAFVQEYDLDSIEPFTMVMWQEDRFIELRWDGLQKHSRYITEQQSIYSSSTLYNEIDAAIRKEWFDLFLNDDKHQMHSCQNIDSLDLWQFHEKTFDAKPSIGIMMKRIDGPLTVSTSQLTYEANEFNFKYYEYQSQKTLHINAVI